MFYLNIGITNRNYFKLSCSLIRNSYSNYATGIMQVPPTTYFISNIRCYRPSRGFTYGKIYTQLFDSRVPPINEMSMHKVEFRKRKVVNSSTLAQNRCRCQINFDKEFSKIRLIGNVNINERFLSSCEAPVVYHASHGLLLDIEKSYLERTNAFAKSKNILLNELELLKYIKKSLLGAIQQKKIAKNNDVAASVITPSIVDPFVTTSYLKKLPHYYASLAKFRLTGLVVLTAMAGYGMAPVPFDLLTFATLSLGTAFTSSSANSINQILEVKYDGLMARTQNRVLVKGLLSPLHVLTFATVCGGTGIGILYFGVNELTGVLGALNLIIYTSIYTPMKQISIANTWVGSVVGAIPPLMGWAACTGSLSPGAFIIGGFLYAWQFPHFNALSWNIRKEYIKAGYKMMSSSNPELCRKTALRYSAALIPLSIMAPVFNLTTWTFAFDSLPLNLYFTYLAWNFYKESDSKSSRKLFRFSLFHLPALMLLMLISKKEVPSTAEEDKDHNRMSETTGS